MSSFQKAVEQPQVFFLSIRYVDNRCILANESEFQQRFLQVLKHEHFYGYPVELETVDTQELLGFQVESAQRTVLYKQPDRSQLRTPASAGSDRLSLSGLQSRLTLIFRYTFPESATKDSAWTLTQGT